MGVLTPGTGGEYTLAFDRDAQCTRVVFIRDCALLDLDARTEVDRVLAVNLDAGWVEVAVDCAGDPRGYAVKRRRGRFQLVVKRGKG